MKRMLTMLLCSMYKKSAAISFVGLLTISMYNVYLWAISYSIHWQEIVQSIYGISLCHIHAFWHCIEMSWADT